jgi:hypothetical protein
MLYIRAPAPPGIPISNSRNYHMNQIVLYFGVMLDRNRLRPFALTYFDLFGI